MNVVAAIPVVFQTVKAVEALFPASPGKEKLDAAISMLQQIYGDIAPLIPVVTTLIGSVVSLLNAAGVFQKKA